MNVSSNRVNYFFNTAYQVFAVLAPLVTAPYISRVLGPDGIGQCSYSYSIVSYFVLLATFGSTIYGQREVSYNMNDKKGRSSAFWNVFVMRFLLSSILILIYLSCLYSLDLSANKTLFCIQSLYILNVSLDVTWYFQGRALFVPITIRNTIIRILSIIAIFLFVKQESDTLIYAFILGFSATLSALVTWPLLIREIEIVDRKNISLINTIKGSFPLFVPTIAIQIYTVMDKTMIGLFTVSSSENGYYEEAERMVKITIILITSLSTVLAPKIAEAYKRADEKQVLSYLKTLISYVFIVGIPICLGLIAISKSFIPFFLGAGFEKCILLMKVLAPIVLFIGFSNAIGTTFLIQTHRQNVVNTSVVVGASINLILNLVLIRYFFSLGAAISSVIAEGSVLLYQLSYLRRNYNISYLFGGNIKYLISGFIMFLLTMGVAYFLRSYNIYDGIITLAQVLIGITSYFLVLVLMKDKFMYSLINLLKHHKNA